MQTSPQTQLRPRRRQSIGVRFPTPAHRIVEQLGGPKRVAELTGRHVSRVYRWLLPRGDGGTGGAIPRPAQNMLVEAERLAGRALDYADFAPHGGERYL